MGLGDALGGIAGGIVGNLAAQGDQDAATAARQAALQQFLDIKAPTIEEQRIALQNEQLAGELNPALQGTVTQDPSQMAGISIDPRLKDAQMNALAQLGDISKGGLTAQDRMNLMQITNQNSGDAEAASKAVMQNMAARGMAGGGAELAARLIGSQNAVNRNANAGQSLAAQAQQRALGAMAQGGQMAQGMQAQSFNEQAQQASAQDMINRFNAQNRQNVMGQNVGAQNAAQQYNLSNKQNVLNANTGIANQQEVQNKGLYQQDFNNQMQKAYGTAGQYGKLSGYDSGQAAQTRGMWAGLGAGAGDLASSLAGAPSSAPSGGGYYDYGQGAGTGPLAPKSGSAAYAHGGLVKSETHYKDGQIAKTAHHFAEPDNMKNGGKIPGKAKVEGDSLENDTVPINVSPGEGVVPRSVMQSEDLDKIMNFIMSMKHGKK